MITYDQATTNLMGVLKYFTVYRSGAQLSLRCCRCEYRIGRETLGLDALVELAFRHLDSDHKEVMPNA